jgi:hypothetical protein
MTDDGYLAALDGLMALLQRHHDAGTVLSAADMQGIENMRDLLVATGRQRVMGRGVDSRVGQKQLNQLQMMRPPARPNGTLRLGKK